MIRIRWAGNTKSELHAPAEDRCDRPIKNREDNSRYYVKWKDHPDFKPAYDAFKAGQASVLNGTPIAELPFLTEGQRLELKAINILTAEALANVDPNSKLGSGLKDLRQDARNYLERAAGAAVDARHEADKAALQQQIDELRALVETGAGKTKLRKIVEETTRPETARILAKAAELLPEDPATSTSPFASWEPDDIRSWIKDADPEGDQPHARLGKAKLVEFADDLNARLRQAAA
jgi:hypothetical protein